jgi:RHS repeat-associated protein
MQNKPKNNDINNKSISSPENRAGQANSNTNISLPSIDLPKGGGAIKGIDEKFSVNAANGTISFGVPLPIAGGRGFAPQLGLGYNSGAGNSPFGFGWNVMIPSIARRTDKQLPKYQDHIDSDTFVIAGAEDLVPMLVLSNGNWEQKVEDRNITGEGDYSVKYYRPRIEGAFARIELWRHKATDNAYWRTISGDNISTIYGKSPRARIADPADPSRIYEWLIERTFDDKGRLIEYNYKSEDEIGIPVQELHNKNRLKDGVITYTNTYLKRIRYGNQDSFVDKRHLQSGYDGHFLFETVFDYGEFDGAEPWRGEVNDWDYRPDAFSMYRAGFEIRTTRLCKRVLLFHHIPVHGTNDGYDGLVSSLDLGYNINPSTSDNIWPDQKNTFDSEQPKIFTFLTRLSSIGYKKQADGSYTSKSLPPAIFEYQPHAWDLEFKTPTPDSLAQLPVGIDDRNYALIDFFSEGIAGILTEQNDGWYYKDNLGDANFAPTRLISPKPSFAGISSGVLQIADLEGNGTKQIASYSQSINGFFDLAPDENWQPFQAFEQLPNIDFADPNLRLIDLDGDGKPDLLITEQDAFVWYQSSGKKGFGSCQRINTHFDEEKGPVLVFADQEISIFLADMSGDGLTDLVRIRNGEFCYWPNLGYGRFGAKVSMDYAPVFDYPDQFNPQYIRLADIDGSGITDVLYLGQGKCRCWFNLSGNAWAETPVEIPLPKIDNLTNVTVADLMGNGTACVVWSSPLPGNAGMQMRFIDLMAGRKPHLLRHYENNMGKEVGFEFKSSTHYYLEDKKAGTPWITKLPFPVHCLEKVVVRDLIRDTVFANSYTYHHGYFDYNEREFRGFGRVEQLDTEEFNLFSRRNGQNVVAEEHHQPPVRSVTWFHTGAFVEGKKMLDQYEHEYYKNETVQEHELPEPAAPVEINADEYREALRAFKGMALRTEAYADDGSDKAAIPYSTSRATYQVRMVQPRGRNQYASFLVFGGESITYGYDRNPSDPRISHSMVLESNELGQPLTSAAVVYPRIARPTGENAIPDAVWTEQNKGYITVSTAAYTNDIDQPDEYRLRAGCESKSFELLGQNFASGEYFTREGLLAAFQGAMVILFEDNGDGTSQKRLSGHSRAYFLKNDLSDPTVPTNRLPLGTMESLGIGYRGLQMAFTPGLIAKHYAGKVTDAMLLAAKYEHSEGDANWWIPSGTAIYPADAATQFYLPTGARDPLGTESRVVYDAFKLTVVQAIDAIGNTISAEIDYRTLGPVLVTDPNGNRSAVETDELGMVIKSAVLGKTGAGEGDTLADPTARMEYDLFNWMNNGRPNYAHTFVREQHGAANPRWQESYVYSDGSGGIIMAKSQAEPGPALRWNDATNSLETVGDENTPRWIGNGRTVLNNKGNPIKQYEPYFSTSHEYEDEAALVEIGISPVLYYDPIGRNYRTDFPNETFTKSEFDPWHSKVFDTNDTVRDSQWYADRGSPDPSAAEPTDPERRAAWLAANHHNTPSVAHTDSLGRTIYAISDYGGGKTTSVRSETDLVGRYSRVFDQKDRRVASGFINMAGMSMYGESAEKGERWIFQDVIGRLVRIWDNNLREFYTTYDIVHRPVSAFVREGGQDTLFNHTVYGDQLPDATARNLNLKGIPFRVYDPAGVLDLKRLDFKGNPLEIERRLVSDYKNSTNWAALNGLNDPDDIAVAAEPMLEAEVFAAGSTYDALSRPILTTLPDKTVMRPTYNEGNGLDKLEAQIRGLGAFRTFLAKQDYDAKGQRQYAEYGNGLVTRYFYDPKTFRLTNLLTDQQGNNPDPDTNTSAPQNLKYHFDPVGNITQIRDDAQQTHYFRNAVVSPMQTFEYDALYQLIRATGRESAGLNPAQPAHGDIPSLTPVPHTNDVNAVRTYTQVYDYDDLGNITRMQHITPGGIGNWTRLYRYAFETDAANRTNLLTGTNRPNEQDGSINDTNYLYDLHGNMTRMPHLQVMDWNYLDQLRHVDLGGGGNAWYVYSGGGQRIRKVIERNGGKRIERIYLGAVEIYRERQGNNPANLERWTTHISDNTGRIAQVDTKTRDNNNDDPDNPLNAPLIRYQYGNHLGSAVLETDEAGVVISYEEYHPYGTSAYSVAKSASDLSLKRYRFSGKERDDETGLYYFGARYYAAWLGRWTSSDPAGFVDGFNLYVYCRNNPVALKDANGMGSGRTIQFNTNIDAAGNFSFTAGIAVEDDATGTSSFTPLASGGEAELSSFWDDLGTGSGTSSQLSVEERGLLGEAVSEALSDIPIPAPCFELCLNLRNPEIPLIATPSQPRARSRQASESQSTLPEAEQAPIERMPTIPPPNLASDGGAATLAAPAAEKFIWNYQWEGGLNGASQRGFILQNMYTNNPNLMRRDNVPRFDQETSTHVKQIKSTNSTSTKTLRSLSSSATSAAGEAVASHPNMAGKSPQAVIITPTDAPASVSREVQQGFQRMKNPPTNAVAPEHIRGLPGRVGIGGRILTGVGAGLSAYALYGDIEQGDVPMGIGDSLGVIGGGLEIYAIAVPGAAIAGVSAMSLGLIVGGLGIAITSGVSGYRAYQAGDTSGAIAGGVGVAAGLAITAGAIGLIAGVAAAPVVLAVGIAVAIGVGIFHAGRYFDWW